MLEDLTDVESGPALEFFESDIVRGRNTAVEHIVRHTAVLRILNEPCSPIRNAPSRRYNDLLSELGLTDSSTNSKPTDRPTQIVTRSMGLNPLNNDARLSCAIPNGLSKASIATVPVV